MNVMLTEHWYKCLTLSLGSHDMVFTISMESNNLDHPLTSYNQEQPTLSHSINEKFFLLTSPIQS